MTDDRLFIAGWPVWRTDLELTLELTQQLKIGKYSTLFVFWNPCKCPIKYEHLWRSASPKWSMTQKALLHSVDELQISLWKMCNYNKMNLISFKHLLLFCEKFQTPGKFSKLNLLSSTRIELFEFMFQACYLDKGPHDSQGSQRLVLPWFSIQSYKYNWSKNFW